MTSTSTPISVSVYQLSGLAGFTQPTLAAILDVSAPQVGAQYDALVAVVATYASSTTPLTAADQAKLESAINGLRNLLTQGYTPPGATAPQYITVQQANQLNLLFQSLSAVGVDPTASTIQFGSLAVAQQWQTGVQSTTILNSLFTFVTGDMNRSLQAMIELDYVATGNDLIQSQLTALQTALSTTQSALNNLTTLQNMLGAVSVVPQSNFSAYFKLAGSSSMTVDQYVAAYTAAASAYFGAPISIQTAVIPVDPVSNYQLASTIPANTVGIPPSAVAVPSAYPLLDSINPTTAYYVQFLNNTPLLPFTTVTVNLYSLADAKLPSGEYENLADLLNGPPTISSVKITYSGTVLAATDFIYYLPANSTNPATANNPLATSPALAPYGISSPTLTINGTPQALVLASNATSFYDDLQSAAAQKINPLSAYPVTVLNSVDLSQTYYAQYISTDPDGVTTHYNIYSISGAVDPATGILGDITTFGFSTLLPTYSNVVVVTTGFPSNQNFIYYVEPPASSSPPITDPALAGYGLQAGNVRIDGVTQANIAVAFPVSAATNATFYNALQAATVLKNNIISLSGTNTTPPLYYGIKNTDSAAVSQAIATLGLATKTLPNASTTPVWLGYNTITKNYVTAAQNPATFFSTLKTLIATRTSIQSQIATLLPITPALADGSADPNTLLAKLQGILADLNASFTTTGTAAGTPITASSTTAQAMLGLQSYLIDNYNNTNGALQSGQYQTNVSAGITAAQSLNDTQNNKVTQFLFIFQQYYQSASTILQSITQILQDIARKMSQ